MGSIYIDRTIKIARDWLGYTEGENNWTIFNQVLDECGYYTPQEKQGQPWCASFVNFCLLQAAVPEDRDNEAKKYDAQNYQYQPSRNNLSAGCVYYAGYFRDAGQWYPASEARAGDVIFFGKRGEESHVGLVTEVKDGRIYTIEGNKSDSVAEGDYSVNYSRISGVGRPSYDGYSEGQHEDPQQDPEPEPTPAPDPEPTPEPAPEKTIDELAAEVLEGKWGNGKERAERLTDAGYDYQAVQDRVNEILGIGKPSEPEPKTYTVNVSTRLNVRWGAGTDNPIKYQLQNGAKVTVYEEHDGWGRIGDDAWVCMDYLK